MGMEKKGFCQINSHISGTRGCVNLPKQWNHIWYSSCNWSHHILKLTVVHCYSPRSICLLYKSNRLVEMDVMGLIISAFFKFFMVALISATPLGMCSCWFTTFLGKGSFSGFHLVFPTTRIWTLQVRKLMWEFCQLLSMSVLIMSSKTGLFWLAHWVWLTH